MVFIGVKHHGRVAQGPQIPHHLGAGPAAHLGLGRDGLLDLGVRNRAGGESRVGQDESAEKGEGAGKGTHGLVLILPDAEPTAALAVPFGPDRSTLSGLVNTSLTLPPLTSPTG